MARAEVASASVSSDSIKGLAQSIAKPAYRRLLTAEPALRRAVPALIIAFLLTICVGAVVQVLDHRREAISELVTNANGSTSATALLEAGVVGRRLIDVLGPTQPLTTFGAAAGVLEIPLADGSLAYGTVRGLWSNGELAILHGRADALAAWASDTALTVTLSATTGFVVLILGFAFHWQATRAREADQIYE